MLPSQGWWSSSAPKSWLVIFLVLCRTQHRRDLCKRLLLPTFWVRSAQASHPMCWSVYCNGQLCCKVFHRAILRSKRWTGHRHCTWQARRGQSGVAGSHTDWTNLQSMKLPCRGPFAQRFETVGSRQFDMIVHPADILCAVIWFFIFNRLSGSRLWSLWSRIDTPAARLSKLFVGAPAQLHQVPPPSIHLLPSAIGYDSA